MMVMINQVMVMVMINQVMMVMTRMTRIINYTIFFHHQNCQWWDSSKAKGN